MQINLATLFSVAAAPTFFGPLTPEEEAFVRGLERFDTTGYLDIYGSKNKAVLDAPELRRLKSNFSSYVSLIGREIMCLPPENGLRITTSWVNFAERGYGHAKHHHTNSMLTGVYFLDVESSVPEIYFENPAPNWTIEWNRTEFHIFNNKEATLPVKNGDLVLFPSWLNHYVPKNETDNTRITISFDTILTGPIFNYSADHDIATIL